MRDEEIQRERNRKKIFRERESEGRDSGEREREREKTVGNLQRTILVSRTHSIIAIGMRIALLALDFAGRPSFSAQVPFFICSAKNGRDFFAASQVAFVHSGHSAHVSGALCTCEIRCRRRLYFIHRMRLMMYADSLQTSSRAASPRKKDDSSYVFPRYVCLGNLSHIITSSDPANGPPLHASRSLWLVQRSTLRHSLPPVQFSWLQVHCLPWPGGGEYPLCSCINLNFPRRLLYGGLVLPPEAVCSRLSTCIPLFDV